MVKIGLLGKLGLGIGSFVFACSSITGCSGFKIIDQGDPLIVESTRSGKEPKIELRAKDVPYARDIEVSGTKDEPEITLDSDKIPYIGELHIKYKHRSREVLSEIEAEALISTYLLRKGIKFYRNPLVEVNGKRVRPDFLFPYQKTAIEYISPEEIRFGKDEEKADAFRRWDSATNGKGRVFSLELGSDDNILRAMGHIIP